MTRAVANSAQPVASEAADQGLFSAYEASRLDAVRRGAIVYCLIGSVILLATAVLDPLRFPGVGVRLLIARLAGASALIIVGALLLSRVGERHPHAIGLLAPTVAGAALRMLELVVGRDVTPFDVGTLFAMVGIALLIPWAAGWAALACFHVLVMALAGARLNRGFAMDLFLFSATGMVTVTIAAALERRRRGDFSQQHVLAAAHREAQAAAERYRGAVAALRESETRLRTVIDYSPVVVFALDRSGAVTFSGGKGLGRIGYAPGDMVGHPIQDVLGERFPHVAMHFARALVGEEVSWQGTIEGVTFETRLTPIRDSTGAVSGLIGLATDVSDRQRAEETRLALERKLLETQKLESLGLLAGGIAHDFNNLLGTVLGNAAFALAELPPESAARGSVERIEHAARRGADMTRQLLAYAGEGTVTPEPVDVNAIARETRDLLAVSLPAKVLLTLALDHDLAPLRADPTQLRQVLMNLVLNAAEAIGGAAGAITVRTACVELDAGALHAAHHAPDARPGPYLVIEVRDTGCGMDAATQAKIFDPFFSTKRTGRGLGLASVLGIVRGHGGGLAVTSEPGHGTTFRIMLPCDETVAVADEPARPAETLEPSVRAGRTVLLVDDEEEVRAVTAHMLQGLGCEVLVAGDGQEGVQVFRSKAQVIDAVVIDLTLPRLSGDRAMQEMRRIRPGAPVILMSGRSDERLRARLADEESVVFLRKPFSRSDLRSMIDSVLPEPRR